MNVDDSFNFSTNKMKIKAMAGMSKGITRPCLRFQAVKAIPIIPKSFAVSKRWLKHVETQYPLVFFP